MVTVKQKNKWVDKDFYHFTLEVMQSPVVRCALDRLQLSHVNSNLLCFLVWYACRSCGCLKRKDFVKLQHAVFTWNEDIVEELQRIKMMIELHQHDRLATIKGWLLDEIDIAHQMERNLLLEAVPISSKMKRTAVQLLIDACSNIVNYCKYAKTSIAATEMRDLTTILHAAFEHYQLEEVSVELERVLVKNGLDYNGPVQLNLDVE